MSPRRVAVACVAPFCHCPAHCTYDLGRCWRGMLREYSHIVPPYDFTGAKASIEATIRRYNVEALKANKPILTLTTEDGKQ